MKIINMAVNKKIRFEDSLIILLVIENKTSLG